jgi:hypothetical protein
MVLSKAQIEADNEARTTSLGLFGYACEYFAVAMAANEGLDANQRRFGIALMPVNFLLGQAIELALKAHLRESGATLKRLRGWGHNLEVLFEAAVGKGFSVEWNALDRAMLSLLNSQYCSREFQYIKTGTKTFPQIEPLSKSAAKVLRAAGDQIPHAKGFFLGKRVGRSVLEVLRQ